jgi:formyltetrahydrofolate deformylase
MIKIFLIKRKFMEVSSSSARSILLVSCPDQAGIMREVSDFIAERKGNIVSLQQLVEKDDRQLFMRIKWTSSIADACDLNIEKDFRPIAEKFQMKFRVTCSTTRKTLGLFASTTTHCLEKVLYHHSEGDLPVDIPLVISNSRKTEVVAKRYNIPFYFISTQEEGYEKRQLELLVKHKVNFIGLARYMKVLSAEFVSRYPGRIINIHHSFLPSFVGAKPYHDAYQRGVKLIGATSHFVIPELDQGPIIEQDVSRVREGFDALSLAKQGREVESRVFYYALEKYVQEKLIIYKNRVVVFN